MKRPSRSAAALAVTPFVATAIVLAPAPAHAKADSSCLRAGMGVLKSAGLVDDVAREGLAISTAVALGVAPREGTDVSALPSSLPLSVVLRDHLAGDDSLFIYPWC